MANQFYNSQGIGSLGSDVHGTANASTRTVNASSYNRNMLRGRYHNREKPPTKITQTKRERMMKHRVVDQLAGRWAQVSIATLNSPHGYNKNMLTGRRGKREPRYTRSTRANRLAVFKTRKSDGRAPPSDTVPADIIRELELLKARGYDPNVIRSMEDKIRRGTTHSFTPTESAIYSDLLRKTMVSTPTPQPTPTESKYDGDADDGSSPPEDEKKDDMSRPVTVDDATNNSSGVSGQSGDNAGDAPIELGDAEVGEVSRQLNNELGAILTDLKQSNALYTDELAQQAEGVVDEAISRGELAPERRNALLDKFDKVAMHIPYDDNNDDEIKQDGINSKDGINSNDEQMTKMFSDTIADLIQDAADNNGKPSRERYDIITRNIQDSYRDGLITESTRSTLSGELSAVFRTLKNEYDLDQDDDDYFGEPSDASGSDEGDYEDDEGDYEDEGDESGSEIDDDEGEDIRLAPAKSNLYAAQRRYDSVVRDEVLLPYSLNNYLNKKSRRGQSDQDILYELYKRQYPKSTETRDTFIKTYKSNTPAKWSTISNCLKNGTPKNPRQAVIVRNAKNNTWRVRHPTGEEYTASKLLKEAEDAYEYERSMLESQKS